VHLVEKLRRGGVYEYYGESLSPVLGYVKVCQKRKRKKRKRKDASPRKIKMIYHH
jgi:hypothetical protein